MNNSSSDVGQTVTESDDESTESSDVTKEREVIVPPDGGWGWVVAGAGFIVQFLLDGVSCSFGLLLPDLVATYGSSLSLTSIAPAAYVAVFLLTGPVAALLVQRFGCRLVGFCGGVIASLGIVCCSFAPNIEVFILFFGVVAGFGVGLIYLPTITMSNTYFDKKRGVVAGIITSGSGFGLLALAQLTEVLLDVYGWRGCYLVTGGVVLHLSVCACLMRPLLPQKVASGPGKEADEGAGGHSDRVDARLTYAQIDDMDVAHSSQKLATDLMHSGKDDCSLSIVSVEELDEEGLTHHKSKESLTKVWSSIKNLFLGHNHLGGSHTHISGKTGGYHKVYRAADVTQSAFHLSGQSPRPSRTHHISVPRSVFGTWLEMQVPPSLSHHSVDKTPTLRRTTCEKKPQSKTLYTLSREEHARATHFHSHTGIASSHMGASGAPAPCKHLSQRLDTVEGSGLGGLPQNVFDVSQCARKDQAFSKDGSLTLPPKDPVSGSQPNIKKSDYSLQQKAKKSSAGHDTTEHLGSRLLDHPEVPAPSSLIGDVGKETLAHTDRDAGSEETVNSLTIESSSSSSQDTVSKFVAVNRWFMRQRLLLLFLLGAFLIQLASNVPTLLTPSYAYLYDVTKEQSAQILSIYGLMNTAGRLGTGLLVYLGCSSLRVHNLGTVLGGVACCVFPFCTSFPTIASCLAFFGFFMGAFPPLQPVMLAEYLGIERLASVFGTMCFVKAFANLAGAPLAGAVYGATGLYTIPVAGCGAVLILAGLLHEFVVCCAPSRDQNVSKDNDVID